MDCLCHEKGNIRNTEGRKRKKKRAAKGDMAEVSGERDERSGMYLRHGIADVTADRQK